MSRMDRILVVDDDPELRKLLSDYLTDVGFAVDLAGDGEQMRRSLAQAMPDAIVMDLMLQGTDGLSLTREVRGKSNVPILMLRARRGNRPCGRPRGRRRRLPPQARTTALLGGEVTFTLGASGHIAGVINSPEKQRRNFWANPDAPADADEWLARAESRPGSWWPHWEAWLAQHAGTKKPAPNAPGNQSYLPLRPAPGAYVLESAGPR